MTIGFFDPEYRMHSEAITGYKGSLFSDKKDLMVIKGSDNPALAVRVWLDKRAHWLNWLTETQRKWQRNSRRLHRANHHDTVATRERYVRCVGDSYTIPDAYKGVYRGVCRVPECPYSAVTPAFLCRKHGN